MSSNSPNDTSKEILLTRGDFLRFDEEDPLANRRELFDLPTPEILYFDGNSLGPLTYAARERLHQVVEEQWRSDLIGSWNTHGWIDLPRRTAAKIATLVGAREDEMIVADSTSINLFKVLSAALELRPERRVILCERGQFPTDVYMAKGLAQRLGAGHEIRLCDVDKIAESIDEDTAVVCLSHVQFKSGVLLDMAEITSAAHAVGALTVWDLSHSGGALPVDLHGCDADFAVGCGYKFFNGGPGAPAYLFAARRLHGEANSPLWGWFGHAAPFAFDLDYAPAPGIDRFLCGTAPILSLAALDTALDAFEGVDMLALREKSIRLGDLFLRLARERCDGLGLETVSPENGAHRGSQVSLRFAEGYALVQALIAQGVIPDFRAPDIARFGLAPLYMRYIDVWDAVEILRKILQTRSWDRPEYHRKQAVT